ncbi:ABC transporter substrate-binding protein [Halovenus rubra]|uniref:ABC transporter substrate-binding protein n=3 Tax=Halovenus rubra TaxID=869890 RepID=A0ACC7DYR0_9EURY|nr:ABC transporter substrate-binding protein [Halovenus rubra]
MNDDTETTEAPTRRDYVKYGGAIIGGSLLAGCTSDSSSEGTPTPSETGTDTATPTQTATEDTYSVRMAPMGEVIFEEVPETAYAYSPHYADMAVAFGHRDAIASLGAPDAYVTSMNYYYDAIDGASIESDDLRAAWSDGVDKELFYDLDADVHFQDPCWLRSFAQNWEQEDIEEVRENIGPWFGNRYSREHTQPPEGCREDYRYYTLWELSERVAGVFREGRRFEAFRSEYEELYGRIRANLPPESERPTVGLIVFSDGTFRPYKLNNPGFAKAHLRPFGVQDAFADSDQTYNENEDGRLDYEAMLAANPDVILHSQGISGFFDVAAIRKTLEDHSVGSELTAVQSDRVYSSGTPFQGPLMHLFQLEMTAKQLYPDIFGEWPADGSEDSYPEIPVDERLFDRERVANIINGKF